jgi:lipopolysaccharide transport system ATP-binding protein
MSSDIAISVEGLSKCYLVGHNAKQEAHPTLRDQIVRQARDFARKTADMARGRAIVQGDTVEEFWALRDVSFEIPRGARVGILGRNGAGKSTLLKLLSRITEPNSGRININGRVASLLEVGTGFHPELSGRENIFLNGAILGMSRREIQNKFDEIVAFAEVEKFLDTPVKRYSSGMYVRLAFAVAAHLESEILIVDEVLAVGDSEFQKKCLGKMDDVSKSGRTVLFVSHNILAVQKLCRSALLLTAGRLELAGSVDECIGKYIVGAGLDDYCSHIDTTRPTITNVRLLTVEPRLDREIEISVRWNLPAPVPGIKIGIGINTLEGQRVFDTAPEDFGKLTPWSEGLHEATMRIPAQTLAARTYSVSAGIWLENDSLDHVSAAFNLSMVAAPIRRYKHQSAYDGLVFIPTEWQV